ncbi:tripartite motif-containing protein 52-like [Alligator sinensis]|uniref:RING-type E3 ubiquitin transferase n=1 Tax=Alligator sinensis TaxID=38654 RepID=A0A1U7SZ04_ALLSI|nr:tripartite motif-containing protein 52-like [Alligator sinensis]
MASLTPDWEIHDETKCPICLEYFTDPVSVECGHNFCRSCISQCCEQLHRMECPICRGQIQKKHFRPNWDLANIVGKVRQWDSSLSSVKEAEVNLCVKHKKSLDLFCEEDREAVCVVCERSPEHSSHTVLLLDEAAQKCKEQIQTHLQTLKGEREKLKEFQVRAFVQV